MTRCRHLIGMLCLTVVFVRYDVFAKGRHDVIAFQGQPAVVFANWPEGVSRLVNDASRTSGWTSSFPELPNDVKEYALEIKSTDELNQLIEKLAAIKCPLRQIRLSPLGEPNELNGATILQEGNGIPVIFSIGDQVTIDEWFKGKREPLFGGLEFTAKPEAIPPTLTVFVQNRAVKLNELRIPEGIEVLLGDVPSLFHKFQITGRTTQEPARPNAWEPSSATSRSAIKQIEAYLGSQKNRTRR